MTRQEKLLEKYKKILRIEDWDIELFMMEDEEYQQAHGKDFAFATEGCTEIHTGHHSNKASIYIKKSLDFETFKEVLLHECVHLVTHPYDSFVRETLQFVDSKRMGKKFKNDAMWNMEINVSKFTRIIGELI